MPETLAYGVSRVVLAMWRRILFGDNAGLRSIFHATDLHDHETAHHSLRVADLALAVGGKIGMRGPALANLWLAALLHDVGKIGVPESVLHSHGRLTEEGWRTIKRHPLIGYAILIPVVASRHLAELALFHHENFDGTGYPFGLRGRQIPLVVRIASVCDSYDAMRSDRPYRKGRSVASAYRELDRCSGTQFDPFVVAALKLVLHEWNEWKEDA